MPFRMLAITQSLDDPATRYRLGLYLPALERTGVRVETIPWPLEEPAREALVASANDFDSVVVFRRLLPIAHALRLRAFARRLAYDFDDAVMYRDAFLGRPVLLLDKLWQFRAIVSQADAVTAGNRFLADRAAPFAPKRTIRVVPTVLDPNRYDASKRVATSASSERDFVLGWIGQASTMRYLEGLEQPLARIAGRHPGCRLRVISDRPPQMKRIPIEFCRWSSAREASDLAGIDIGLAPLTDDVWSRGKCGLRMLQYFASGVATVCSPVGVQGDWADEGAAIPARSHAQWHGAIEALISDPANRIRLARQGQQLVRDRFTPKKWEAAVVSAWTGITVGINDRRIAG